MKRPFADLRPVGPLAQSDQFTQQLLGSSNSSEHVKEGDTLLIEVLGEEARNVPDMLRDVVDTMAEFVILQHIGGAEGRREQTVPGRDVDVGIEYYYVDRVQDPDVTLRQIEQFIEQEMQGSPANIFEVNIYKE